MAQDADGNIIDLYGGKEDIQNKIIRAVGEPEERFNEDPLRMLRALQFAVRFGFTIEPKTAAAIKKLSDKFQTIAPERILGEFKKAWVKGSQNTDLFIKLLDDLGVGETLFGKDFQPKAVKVSGDPNDLTNANFVSFFLLGGDPAALRPTNEMMSYLQIARSVLSGEKEVWEFGGKAKDKLPLVASVLKSFDKKAAAKIEDALSLPLSPQELVIGGRELMSLGLKGPQIGQAQQDILRAIHSGEIKNEPEDIEDFLQRKAT